MKGKADKNRKPQESQKKNNQELQKKAFTKPIIIYPHIKPEAGVQLYRVSEKRDTFAQDLA